MKPDTYFFKKFNNIETTNNISVFSSILGGVYNVKTIWGEEKVEIPKGSITGDIIKIKNKGIQYGDEQWKKGDHIMYINLTLPSMNSKQLEIMKKIKKLELNWLFIMNKIDSIFLYNQSNFYVILYYPTYYRLW